MSNKRRRKMRLWNTRGVQEVSRSIQKRRRSSQLGKTGGPKCGNSNMRTGSLGSNSRVPNPGMGPSGPVVEVSKHASRLATLSRLFKPWKWKRKKKSDKFEQTSRTLERKISMRATKEELIQRGVLLSDRELGSPSQKDNSPSHHPQANGTLPSDAGLDGSASVISSPKSDGASAETSSTAGMWVPSPPPPGAPAPTGLEMLTLSALPEPPIAVSEIGPIPPPPMFSNPSPTLGLRFAEGTLVEEIPAKEPPQSSALPRKSALKKQQANGVGPPHATQQQLSAARHGSHVLTFLDANYNRVLVGSLSLLRVTCRSNSPSTAPNRPESIARPRVYTSDTHNSRMGAWARGRENSRPGDSDSDSDDDGPINWRDYYGDDEQGRLAAKIARKDSLALKLAQRPDRQELIDKNILLMQSDRERQESREAVGNKLTRRLSLRPTVEELEQRNILKLQTAEELKKEKEQKKKVLIRKLSFRPTIEELKERKIIRFNDYVEVTQAQDYDRRADKPWTRLTPKDKAAIRKELNEFKSMEMRVHEDSRHLTR
ncbi:unnamed protein product [Ixodes hexagonus]